LVTRDQQHGEIGRSRARIDIRRPRQLDRWENREVSDDRRIVDDSIFHSKREVTDGERTAWTGIGNQIDEDVQLCARSEPDLEIYWSEERSLTVGSLVPFSAFLELNPPARYGPGVSGHCRALGLN
jgi:hypothetical protein